MKKFRVLATMYVDLELEVEAKDADEAYQIARDTDDGEFAECHCSGDWVIGDVMEVNDK